MNNRVRWTCVAWLVASILVAGCTTSVATSPTPSSPARATTASPATSTTAPPPTGSVDPLDRLIVAPPYTEQPYRRAMFGEDWIDADGDCHNTRAEVLMQETTAPVTFNPNGCTVATGQWTDPWSGFTSTNAADFQIDHTVPLADAWRSGAWAWDDARRLAFANDLDDPNTLNALRGTVNESKGDKGPEAWRPPLPTTWCAYAQGWARIKATWGLTVTSSELAALKDMATTCA